MLNLNRLNRMIEISDYRPMQICRAIGIHQTTLLRIRKGQHNPSFNIVCRLADLLNISIDYLRRQS